jgi:hypothetical protein
VGRIFGGEMQGLFLDRNIYQALQYTLIPERSVNVYQAVVIRYRISERREERGAEGLLSLME